MIEREKVIDNHKYVIQVLAYSSKLMFGFGVVPLVIGAFVVFPCCCRLLLAPSPVSGKA